MTKSDLIESCKASIEAVTRGDMVIISDDPDRENEGDIALAADSVTTEQIAFLMREARGLICVPLSRSRARDLKLPLQTLQNNTLYQTAFAVSVDHKDVAPRGASAESRAYTIRKLADPKSVAEDFVSPGSVFPLLANRSGVFGRRGQTEASYDLARLAGRAECAVICEILHEDGHMSRGSELEHFAKKHGLVVTSVEGIFQYRSYYDVRVQARARASLETAHGLAEVWVFEDEVDEKEHLVVRFEKPATEDAPLVRIHSECLTGDVLGSRRCDCGPQLTQALQKISQEGGLVLYLRQEGRGIGLANKLRAYALQEKGRDTVQANLELGFEADQRDFRVAAKILESLGVRKVRLMTNNPKKCEVLSASGLEIVERVPLLIESDDYQRAYLNCKRDKLGHLL